jgi:cysteine desulfurase
MKEKFTKSSQAYFDCNATTPVLAAAAQAALHAMETLYGNPSSTHLVGLQAKNILESTRALASQAVGSDPSEIIFTSGATEAIQTAIFSALQHVKIRKSEGMNKLLYAATEHKAVPMALKYWVKMLDLPYEIVELPVDRNGQLQLEFFKRELVNAALVCTMAVNNEVGAIQDLTAIEKILVKSRSEALWLVDCVQALGKVDLNLNRSRIDYAPFSGHKLYAPKGIGFLYVRKGSPFFPLIVGGGQENGFRSGTENLPGVAALGAMLKELLKRKEESEFQPHERLVKFRDQLSKELKQAFPKILFNTPIDFSVPTTINFSVPGFKSGELLDIFDSAGLRVSAGSACSSSSVKPSHVLDAMGFPEWRSASALRLSFGPCTLEQEINLGCQLIQESASVLKNNCLLETSNTALSPSDLKDGILHFIAGHSNSWVIVDRQSRSCIILDPTEPAAERIENFVRCQSLEVLAILDTHSHADHESVRPVFQKLLSDKMKRSGSEFGSLGWPKKVCVVQLDGSIEAPAILINSSVEGDLVLARLETPGHTLDSVSYFLGLAKSGKLSKKDVNFVFSGDLILSGGLGRTNFSISSPSALFYSLKKLESCISRISVLCPAHDYDNSYATNLETEIRRNPLLSSVLDRVVPMTPESFIERKMQVDRDLLDPEDNSMGEVICGAVSSCTALQDESLAISGQSMKDILSKRPSKVLVVDVRESPEHLLSKNWEVLGFPAPPMNVPLSRFANFIGELSKSGKHDQEMLFICRSGGRSLIAAKTSRRLGFNEAFSLKGGISLIGD